VTDFASLFLVAGSIAVVVLPVIVLDRWLAGAEGSSLADILAIPIDPPWPRGVQEEEPVRWHVEALRPRRDRPGAAELADRKPTRIGAGLATEGGDC
jgi:cell division septation protein DedD